MSLHWLDILTLLLYMSAMLALGFYFSKKNVDTEEYFVGGRSFSGWVIGLSLVGTSISSITFLAYPADAFKTTWIRFIMNFSLPIAIIVAAFVFLPFFRRGKITSAYQYLEERFGPSIRVYGSLTFVFGQLVRVSLILYLVSLVLHEMIGLSPEMSIVIAGGFVVLYTVIGGIDAVIWTDVIQTIILLLGGIFVLMIIVIELPGGLGQIFSVAIADGKLSFSELSNGSLIPLEWGFSLSQKTGTMMLILGLVSWLTEYSSNQNVIQRYCAAKSTKEARKAMYVTVLSSIPIWAFYMFIGTSLYVFFKVFPTNVSGEILEGTRKAEQILPYFIMNYLPPGITGLVISAALAAAMSSLDSSINAISAVGIVDIYRRHLVKDQDDKHYLKIAKIIAVIVGVIMISGAILLARSETKTLQDTATILASLVGGGMLGIYLIGFLTNKGNEKSVLVGIVTTIAFTGWTILSKKGMLPNQLSVPFDLYYTSIIGNIVMFMVGYFASLLLPDKQQQGKIISIWTLNHKTDTE